MLYRQNPGAMLPGNSGFSENDLKRVDIYQHLASMLPPDELAKEMNPFTTPQEQQARDDREAAGRELAAKVNMSEILNAYDKTPGTSWHDPSWAPWNWGGVPIEPPDAGATMALRKDFAEMFGVAYSRVPDADKAKDMALKWMDQKWGVTDTGAGSSLLEDQFGHQSSGQYSTLMAFPPERYYPIVNGDHAWMGEQLQEFVNQQVPGARSYNVITTPQTEADIAAGIPPSYNIAVTDKNGVFRLLSNTDGGMNVRFDISKALADTRAQFTAKRQGTMIPAVTPFGSRSARVAEPRPAQVGTPPATPTFGSGGPTLP